MKHNLIDHLLIFVTVVECGSFSEAGRRLNRAVSSISYAVGQMEKQCGFELIDRTTRRSELTEKGRALFGEAKFLVEGARRLSSHMKALEKGEETRIRIAVDVLFPLSPVLDALRDFSAERPRTRVQLFTSSLNSLWDDLREGQIDFAVTLLVAVPPDMTGRSFQRIELSPAVAARHRLATLPEPVAIHQFQSERQIYFIGSPQLDVERAGRILGSDVWTANDLEHIRRMVVAGLGWCFANDVFFAQEEASGIIKRVRSDDSRLHPARSLGAVWPIERPPGPSGHAFIAALGASLNDNGHALA